jgi:hypothetical protein
MAVAFTLSAIFVVVDPIANVFHSPFWMGKEKKKETNEFSDGSGQVWPW